MDKGTVYYKQVQLLVQVLPLIANEKCFALKGGTAINLFVRELPRLSVDIDLVYLPVKSRGDSLVDIQQALGRISGVIEANLAGVDAHKSYADKPDALRLIVQKAGVENLPTVKWKLLNLKKISVDKHAGALQRFLG